MFWFRVAFAVVSLIATATSVDAYNTRKKREEDQAQYRRERKKLDKEITKLRAELQQMKKELGDRSRQVIVLSRRLREKENERRRRFG